MAKLCSLSIQLLSVECYLLSRSGKWYWLLAMRCYCCNQLAAAAFDVFFGL